LVSWQTKISILSPGNRELYRGGEFQLVRALLIVEDIIWRLPVRCIKISHPESVMRMRSSAKKRRCPLAFLNDMPLLSTPAPLSICTNSQHNFTELDAHIHVAAVKPVG